MITEVYGETWYAETAVTPAARDALVYDLDVDVCVIGGGLAGLTAAREAARRGYDVAVLEAQRVAWSASGRNTGLVAPGFAQDIERLIERVGIDHARALWQLSREGVDYVAATIGETRMPKVTPAPGWLRVSRVDDADRIDRLAELIGIEFGTAAAVWPIEQVRAALDSTKYFQAIHLPQAFHIHALNYALGLAAAAEAQGVRIFEHTPALAIDSAGVRKRIDTPKGRVRAAHVVLAAGAHLAPLVPEVARAILPLASYVATTQPLGGRLGEAIRYRGAVTDMRRIGNSWRVVEGDRLMWGGHLTARLSEPRRLARMLERDIARTFPQLAGAKASHAWSGTMGVTAHGMPLIGELSPGLWVAAGFGQHGLNTTAMAGELIGGAITQGDDRWRLFAPFEVVWIANRFGRVAARTAILAAHLRDRLAERRTHNQIAAGKRADAKAERLAAIERSRQAAAEQARARAEAQAARYAAAQQQAREEAERAAAEEAVKQAAREIAITRVASETEPASPPAEPPPWPGAQETTLNRRMVEAVARQDAKREAAMRRKRENAARAAAEREVAARVPERPVDFAPVAPQPSDESAIVPAMSEDVAETEAVADAVSSEADASEQRPLKRSRAPKTAAADDAGNGNGATKSARARRNGNGGKAARKPRA